MLGLHLPGACGAGNGPLEDEVQGTLSQENDSPLRDPSTSAENKFHPRVSSSRRHLDAGVMWMCLLGKELRF